MGPDNCVSAVTAGSEAAEAGAAAGDKLVSISVGEAPPVWTAADSAPLAQKRTAEKAPKPSLAPRLPPPRPASPRAP